METKTQRFTIQVQQIVSGPDGTPFGALYALGTDGVVYQYEPEFGAMEAYWRALPMVAEREVKS